MLMFLFFLFLKLILTMNLNTLIPNDVHFNSTYSLSKTESYSPLYCFSLFNRNTDFIHY